ncbi:MAG: hypothetical protein IPH44_30305 [Myxococcales bacterium]|jgi:hypothetical protein|nr:hypothetical protein [Myxococcales bacterium]MBK7194842.1 hypothetical protein [Myxococcales bacterium]MBP6849682.1 hypothetical protein [Kofleriaceae bacterium]
MADQKVAVRRWLAGQRAAAVAQRDLQAQEGPRPAIAVEQSLSALAALEFMGRWPGPRDPVADRQVTVVRQRWAKIQRRARDEQR